MAIETELKLRLSPTDLACLRRHGVFKLHRITDPVTRRLHNIYYDTPELNLHQSHMALRLRRVGGRWLQTLKGGGAIQGFHQRNEWEVPVVTAKLDFSGLDGAVWDKYLPLAWRDILKPVFVTDFYRTSQDLLWQGSRIEVCMDKGVIKTSQSRVALCEVELELKSGDPLHLFEFAKILLGIVPLEMEVVSKAEQGFRLLSAYVPHPVPGVLPQLGLNLTDSLKASIWSCLQHFQRNLSGAMIGDDAEYLHQLRLALRRLRFTLRLVVLQDPVLTRLRGEFSVVGKMLGEAREWDVLVAGTIVPLQMQLKDELEQQNLQALLECCQLRRACRYSALRLRSRELQELLLELCIWMHGSYWQHAVQDEPELSDFARHNLQKAYRQFMKLSAQLDNTQQLHQLRIAVKKLRYRVMFFSGLYDEQQVKHYIFALSDIQDVLGNIHDISIANSLLDEIVFEQLAISDAVVMVKRVLNRDAHYKTKEIKQAVKRVFDSRRFWNVS